MARRERAATVCQPAQKAADLVNAFPLADPQEGIRVKGKKAFSVQYHPESSPGPHDSRYLFDEFIQLIKGELVW